MIPCVWYVSKLDFPWERAVVGAMASALRAQGVVFEIYADGGTADFGVEGALSWQSMTLPERLRRIFRAPALWHLWGRAPWWWSTVRARSRTVHTSLAPSVVWKGHPTRLFFEQTVEGESWLKPTFEAQVTRDDEPTEAMPSIFWISRDASPALSEALTNLAKPTADVGRMNFRTSVARSGVFVARLSPSDALLAACLAMQGLTIVGPDSSFLKELLGDDGYIVAEKDDPDAWAAVLEQALSKEGRTLSVSTRHRLKTHYSQGAAADSLVAVYKRVEKGWNAQ